MSIRHKGENFGGPVRHLLPAIAMCHFVPIWPSFVPSQHGSIVLLCNERETGNRRSVFYPHILLFLLTGSVRFVSIHKLSPYSPVILYGSEILSRYNTLFSHYAEIITVFIWLYRCEFFSQDFSGDSGKRIKKCKFLKG